MDRIEDRIDDEGKTASLGVLRGANEGLEIAMRRGHEDRRRAGARRDIESGFIEAQKKIRSRLSAARELLAIGGIRR